MPYSRECMYNHQNIQGCFICHHRTILKIAWKSVCPFCCNVAKRHDAAPSMGTVDQSSQAWNSLPDVLLCHAQHIIRIAWKAVQSFFHNFAIKHGSKMEHTCIALIMRKYWKHLIISWYSYTLFCLHYFDIPNSALFLPSPIVLSFSIESNIDTLHYSGWGTIFYLFHMILICFTCPAI